MVGNITKHRQSTDTPPTVDRYTTDRRSQHIGRGVGRVSTDISTDNVGRRSINSDNMSTDTRPSLGRHIGRVSVEISAACRSAYRPIVSTDTRSTDAFSTHDPKEWVKHTTRCAASAHCLLFEETSDESRD